MVLYDIRTALLGFRRNPLLSAVIVGGIALGIGVSTLFWTIRHVLIKDPLPHKSDRLVYVRLDSWDPEVGYPTDPPGGPPPQISYRDMVGIMESKVPVRQTGAFKTRMWVFPDAKVGRPRQELVRLAFADFFPMFEVPFRYGGPWDRSADAGPEPVVVLSEALNDELFGGQDSVGRTVRLNDRDFRVVGVLAHWRPSVRFYDLTQNPVGQPVEPIFIPFNWMLPLELNTAGNSDSWRGADEPGFKGSLASEQVFIQFWAELPEARQARAYHDWLDAYALEQRKLGRFLRPLNNRVTPLPELMDEEEVVPTEIRALSLISLLFLAVCALNLTGLLLAKFLARAPEVGVRRALGARRRDVFIQHIVECETAALLGGVAGLGLAYAGTLGFNQWAKTVVDRDDLLYLDLPMLGFAVGLALVAGLIAGVYPAWRVCRTAPAVHLKLQ